MQPPDQGVTVLYTVVFNLRKREQTEQMECENNKITLLGHIARIELPSSNIANGLFTCLFILLWLSVYTHLLVAMSVDDTKILNFTCLNDDNYSVWVVHIEADLVSWKL
jgi:hypothetical protein